jgi:hypothetical protein
MLIEEVQQQVNNRVNNITERLKEEFTSKEYTLMRRIRELEFEVQSLKAEKEMVWKIAIQKIMEVKEEHLREEILIKEVGE